MTAPNATGPGISLAADDLLAAALERERVLLADRAALRAYIAALERECQAAWNALHGELGGMTAWHAARAATARAREEKP